MRKGCSPNVAAQRVAMLHPSAPNTLLAKREDAAADFMECVDTIMKRDKLESRTEAMSRARRENPQAFAWFQNL